MKSIKEESNILKFRKRRQLNIGIVIFGIIFIYLIATVIMYITAPRITVYEVRQGSILKDNSYTGIVLREEKVINAAESGYINYFAPEGTKVGKLTNVYSISNEELILNNPSAESEEDTTLSGEEQNALLLKTQTFVDSYQDAKFEDIYQLKDSAESIITSFFFIIVPFFSIYIYEILTHIKIFFNKIITIKVTFE